MSVRLSKLGMKEPKRWRFVTQIWAKLSANDCEFVCDDVPGWLLPEIEGLVWGTEWKTKWVSSNLKCKRRYGLFGATSRVCRGRYLTVNWKWCNWQWWQGFFSAFSGKSGKRETYTVNRPMRYYVAVCCFKKTDFFNFEDRRGLYLTSDFGCYVKVNKSQLFVLVNP